MNRLLKIFLLWLLMAALPLQGFAAAMQISCGLRDRHGSAGTATPAQAHHHDGGAFVSHHHRPGTDNAAAHSPAPADKSFAAKQHAESSCSYCAACCVGATAPPSLAVLTPAYSDSLPVVVSLTPLVTGFIPAGLERPPKRITA